MSKKITMPLDSFLDEGTSSWADSAEESLMSRGERSYGYGRDDRDDRGYGRDDQGGYERGGGYGRGGERGGSNRGFERSYDRGRDRGERGYDRDRGYDRGERGGYDRGERGGYDRGERGGYERRDDRRREEKPLPTEPPFTAYVGNLSYDVTEAEIQDYFGRGVLNVRLIRDPTSDRLKGFGYVEFEDLASLKDALSREGESMLGRALRIDVADGGPKERSGASRADEVDKWERGVGIPSDRERGWGDRRGDQEERGWGGRGGFRDRGFGGDRDRGFGGDRDRGYGGDRDRGYGGDRDRGYGRRFGDRGGDRSRYDRSGDRDSDRPRDNDRPRERPKLNLLPRTVDAPINAPANTSQKSSIFGEAKPRDENAILRQKEEERRQRELSRKQSSPDTQPEETKAAQQAGKPSAKETKEEVPTNKFEALSVDEE